MFLINVCSWHAFPDKSNVCQPAALLVPATNMKEHKTPNSYLKLPQMSKNIGVEKINNN
jgi:hypothetical protein